MAITTRYWMYKPDGEISSQEGELQENGDFKYHGQFGVNTIYSGHSFATKNECLMNEIRRMDTQIKHLESAKLNLVNRITEE